MNSKHILATAVAFALPAWTLCAQDNPAPRPADAPQRGENGPRTEGAPRPEGRGGPRLMGGLFDALDTNHDGVIDADEINHAAEVLRKLDRNGDGKLEPEELRPQGEFRSRRPEGGEERGAPRPEQARGDGGPRPAQEGHGPRGFERGDRRDGAPQGDAPRRDGPPAPPRPPGDASAPTTREGPPQAWQRYYHHHEHSFEPGGPDGGPGFTHRGPAPSEAAPGARDAGPQAWQPYHHHGPFEPGGSDPRFAGRDPQRQDDRPGSRPPWENWAPGADHHHAQDRWAMAPHMDGFRGWAPPQGPWEDRRDARGPSPEDGRRDFHLPPEHGNGDRFDRRGGPQPDGRPFGPSPRAFDHGDWPAPRPFGLMPQPGFGHPPMHVPNGDQGMRQPPMPPRQPSPDGERFQPGPHENPRPPGVPDMRAFGPGVV